MSLHWKARLKKLVPPKLLNGLLLRFPRLYDTSLVQLESNIVFGGGATELIVELERILENGVPGDVAECGAARCGTTVMMARRLVADGPDRLVQVFDSFQGFHPEELARERAAGTTTVGDGAFESFGLAYVQAKLQQLGVSDRVELVPGFFEQTIEKVRGPLCLALIDCDLHDSMLLCARKLWPHLSPGGTLAFDDYLAPEFTAARTAVDTFVEEVAAEVDNHALGDRLYFVRKGTARA